MLLEHTDDGLRFDGVRVADLAERFGAPFFLGSARRLLANRAALARGLAADGAPATLRYCVKTNNERGVLEVLAAGDGALVSHAAEAELAVTSGFAADRLAFQRPVLTAGETARVAELGVELFHATSPADVEVLEHVARRAGRHLRVSLRLRNEGSPLSPLHFLSRRLGHSTGELARSAARVAASPHLVLHGVNFYCGTQRSSPEAYRPLLRRAMAFVASRAWERPPEVDLGGGAPSPSLRRNGPRRALARLKDDAPCARPGPEALEAFARGLGALFREEAARAGLGAPPALAMQPGRSIVGNAFVLVARVERLSGRWAFLDASASWLPESTLLFTREVLHARAASTAASRHYDLSGNTLNTRDVLDLHRRLPALATGDVLVLADAGAYSLARASRSAGLAPAAVLIGTDGAPRLIRRVEDGRDLMGPMTVVE